MKKLLAIVTIVALGITLLPSSAYAQANPNEEKKRIREEIKQEREEFRQEIKEAKKEFRQEVKEAKKDFRLDLKLFRDKKATSEAKRKGKAARLINAEVTAVSDASLTVEKDGKTYTVNTSTKTKFRRHFWGKSEVSEFAVGNKVNVWGKWTDETQTAIDAHMIRNLSVMKRHGVFIGQITSVGSGSFVIKSVNRGDQTVLYAATTKFVNRKEQSITASDLKVGDRVRVKGLWDKTNSKITEVKQVKDFSLPTRVKNNSASNAATPSPSASVSVTPTVTPTGSVSATPTP